MNGRGEEVTEKRSDSRGGRRGGKEEKGGSCLEEETAAGGCTPSASPRTHTRSGEKRARSRGDVSSSGGGGCSMAQSEANGVDQDLASKRLHSR